MTGCQCSAAQPLAQRSLRGRFNAWFFDVFGRYINRTTYDLKKQAFAELPCGIIAEIGAGTGANFDFIPSNSTVLAIEPNAAMHKRLQYNARRRGVTLQLLPVSASNIPVADESVDTVIATLVLCTVSDPRAVLEEVQRILRPGGSFLFVEHVAAEPGSLRNWVQRKIARPWAWVFEGCDTRRETGELLAQAGFAHLQLRSQNLFRSVFYPVNSAVWGIATKHDGGLKLAGR